VKAGADTLIVHLEVMDDPRPILDQIKTGLGKKVGLAFNPDMPVSRIEPYLRDIDLALCMTVFPGFGGQAYVPGSNGRIAELKKLIERNNPACEIEVDGGIDLKTIAAAAKAGADVFVAGTAVFGAKNGPAAALKELMAAK
jgi:ribulose-phosphate 3-epimerase